MLTRRTPLKAKKPLARKALKRNRTRKAYKPAKIRFHMNRVAEMGCLISGAPATLHHVTGTIDGSPLSPRRTDRRVVPLAPQYHQKVHDPKAADPISVEGLNHRGFYEKHGIDLAAVADRLWAESEALWEAMHGKGKIDG